MSTTTTRATLEEFAATLDMANGLVPTLGVSPCVALEMFFPAIVGDADIMGALASMLDPAIFEVGHVVQSGGISAEEGEQFIHNVFHLLQIAAALGHAVGVGEALAMRDDIPASLEDVAWNALPDVFGEGQEES